MKSSGSPIKDLSLFGPEVPLRDVSLKECEEYCASLARMHYENFTVVSFLLPRVLRQHFYNVYAFCRWADDMGDEFPDTAYAQKMLLWWETQLTECYKSLDAECEKELNSEYGCEPKHFSSSTQVCHPVYVALRETIREYSIPESLFRDLLSAFKQDQEKQTYTSRSELLEYCRRSANPVGRILLYLVRTTDLESLRLSDLICTGLQLANFWQDVARDWKERGRIYLPQEDMLFYGYTREMFFQQQENPEFHALMRALTDWAESFFIEGAALEKRVPAYLKLDIRLFRAGGQAVLNAMRKQNYNVWKKRPKVGKIMKLFIFLRALCGK